MEVFLQLFVLALMALWSYKVAERNGRDTTIALILGFLFGIFAVIGYYIAGKKEN